MSALDPRFYRSLGPIPLGELAALAGARLADGADASAPVVGVAPLDRALAGEASFLSEPRRLAELADLKAAACFIDPGLADRLPAGCAALATRTPQGSWALAAQALHAPLERDAEIFVSREASLEADVLIGPGAVVGAGAQIGRGTRIGAGAVIGPGVAIGRDCRIGPLASIRFALIGDAVQVLAGARIGEAGFGVAAGPKGPVDIPQLGRVILQDRVTVGANSCVDRGAFDDTVVGEGTKLDNLVHIAHNVRLGRHCVLAAYTGISGSVVVGDGVSFGGRSGVADHLTVGSGAGIAAAAAVMRDVPAGEVWGGQPARPIRRYMRETAWLAREAHARGKKGEGD